MFWRKQVLVAMAIAMLTTSVAYAGPMGGRKQQRSRRIASRVQISADRTYAHIDKRNQREHARFDNSPPPQPTSGFDMRKRQVHVDANDALVIPGPGHDHLPGFQGNDNPPYPFPQPKHGHHPPATAGDAEADRAQPVDVPIGKRDQRELEGFDHSPPPQPTSGLDMRKREMPVVHIGKRDQRELEGFDHSPPPQPTSGLDMRKREMHGDASDALVIPDGGHDHLPGFQGNDNPPDPFPQPKHGHHPTAIAGDAETDPAQLVDVPSVGRKCTKPSTEAEQADTQHLTKRDNGGTPSGPFTRGETSVVITSQLESHPSNKSIFGRCLCGRTLMEEDQGISGICATRFVLSATPTASCKFQGLTSATCVEHGGSENMSEGDDVWWQKAFCKRCRDAGGFSHEWFQCP
ncbi:mig2-6 protein [Mycosarcoma maydis]|uniref:Mig2-6 protein n=2 Tax=Mycosarcoma maydis TaxID=5270 RepID=A0A0D1DPZ4_MYCMD|nr:mig2-6 protein [Ustilago maydis 521]KIS66036.1 mig2-6 protein [Ustilago maydis 521]|eukprot:XP_011392470.1 mig2-6 protein [Ustilago maydis 521]